MTEIDVLYLFSFDDLLFVVTANVDVEANFQFANLPELQCT
jgi:hypothetical protein